MKDLIPEQIEKIERLAEEIIKLSVWEYHNLIKLVERRIEEESEKKLKKDDGETKN